MARFAAVALIGSSIFFAFRAYTSTAFLPPPLSIATPSRHAAVPAAVAGMAGMAGMANADNLRDVAEDLAFQTYPLIKQVDWYHNPFVTKYYSEYAFDKFTALKVSQAALDLGMAMDSTKIEAAVQAHANALEAADSKLLTPLVYYGNVIDAVARMLATAPADKIQAVLDGFKFTGVDTFNRNVFDSFGNDRIIAEKAWFTFMKLAEIVKVKGGGAAAL